MQSDLLSYLENLVESYKTKKIEVQNQQASQSQPKPKPIYVLESFQWINEFCDYKFDIDGYLICTNYLGKTFVISKKNTNYFRFRNESWINNSHVMQVFGKSPFNFKYVTSTIQTQIEDCLLKFNDSYGFRSNFVETPIIPTDTGYEVNIIINGGRNINLNTKKLTEHLLSEPEKYIAALVTKVAHCPTLNIIMCNPVGNIVVKFNKFMITRAIKPEFNNFIISELGKGASNNNVMELFLKREENIKLDAEILTKTLDLIKLVKQKEENKLIRAKIKLLTQVKPKFDKCMIEIVNFKKNKNIDIEKEFANVNKDPGAVRRFMMIWSTDNVEELQKKCNLKENHLELAKYLYKLDKITREQKLLENNIYA